MAIDLPRLDIQVDEQGGGRLTITVHDSLMGEYYKEDWPDIEEAIRDIMTTQTLRFMEERWGVKGLPLEVDVTTGLERWK